MEHGQPLTNRYDMGAKAISIAAITRSRLHCNYHFTILIRAATCLCWETRRMDVAARNHHVGSGHWLMSHMTDPSIRICQFRIDSWLNTITMLPHSVPRTRTSDRMGCPWLAAPKPSSYAIHVDAAVKLIAAAFFLDRRCSTANPARKLFLDRSHAPWYLITEHRSPCREPIVRHPCAAR